MRFLCLALAASAGLAQIFPGLQGGSKPQAGGRDFDISASSGWVDTGIDLAAGDGLKIRATGSITLGGKQASPDGVSRGYSDLIKTYPLNDANKGALIGRIGSNGGSRPFLIGSLRDSRAPVAGRLFLSLNVTGNDRGDGSFRVTVERAAAAPGAKEPAVSVAPFSQSQLDSLPTRVSDAEGSAGDRINFLITGSLEQVQTALKNAGWVTVDRSVKDTVLKGIFASLSKQAYVTLPMSELRLFGRGQDYGYAQGDPLRVVASRHHFRLWKAPFTHGGIPVWVGAGTHDIGFDKDQRNGKITHKIDPQTDGEREYIVESLQSTGFVAKVEYLTPRNTVKEAKTAHGETFYSDGRTAVIHMKPDRNSRAAAFSDYFCSVLKAGGGDWGDCAKYVETAGQADLKLTPIPKTYRVVIIPGLLSSCFSDAPAFGEGQELLKKNYGLTVDLIPMPNDSSESNARRIGDWIREARKTDNRKILLFGYSKGTPDAQVALAQEDGVKDAVAAFVSVAGASGGSPIADSLPGTADRWIRQYNLPKCEGDLATGFRSLQRGVRQEFLNTYPHPMVPSYSLVANAEPGNVSKMLAQTWQIMKTFDTVQDGQLTKLDAIVPESAYLGTLRGDHFAVALPFENSSDKSIASAMDKGHFPRAALLEALVRFVIQDLESAPK